MRLEFSSTRPPGPPPLSDSPHTATFDVPRDVLTPAQEDEFRAFLVARGLLAGSDR